MRKRLATAILTTAIAASMGMTAFAGQWIQNQDNGRWWWYEDDGSNPYSEWVWLDGNQDGVAECYYFGDDGYMLANTVTPDGYQVNENGAWIENGVIQTQGTNNGAAEAEDTTWMYDRENWVGDYYTEEGDYLMLGVGAGEAFAGIYEDGDSGETRVYNFEKVKDTQYKDKGKSATLTLNEDGSITMNNKVFFM